MNQHMFLCVRWLAFFLFLVESSLVLGVPDNVQSGENVAHIHRIVAIGDIHGDAENFLKILSGASLIKEPVLDDDGQKKVSWFPHWKSGFRNANIRTTLVQMGDLIDRGEEDLECLNIAFSLFEQARDADNADNVVLLIGNHEFMNLQGYYHYVNDRNYGGFLSKSLRKAAFDGPFGDFIIDNFQAVHIEDETIFVHAGFSTTESMGSANEVNQAVKAALRNKNYSHPFLRSSGPLWTRKLIFDAMADECADVKGVLEHFGAKRIVVGHTPQRTGKVESYCDDRVFAVDVGLSRWMYGSIAALEVLTVSLEDAATGIVHKETIVSELNEFGSHNKLFSSDSHQNGFMFSTAKSGIDDDGWADL